VGQIKGDDLFVGLNTLLSISSTELSVLTLPSSLVNVLKSSPAFLPHDLPHLQNGRQMTLEKFHVDCFVCFGQYSTMLKLLGRKLQSVKLRPKLQLLLNDSGVIFQPND
jgi:hypothetical protein